ncbi:MAG: amidohydrolase/deacetylase family metallohydrolase [Chloroflexota bacterium]
MNAISGSKSGTGEPQYDLVIKDGHLLDTSQNINGRRDLAILEGRVAAIAEHIPQGQGREILNAAGSYVVPGLMDVHLHGYWGATYIGVDVDQACLKRGVTTVVDAGSAGSSSYEGLRQWIISQKRCRVLAFLNLSAMGLVVALSAPELSGCRVVDSQAIRKVFEVHGDVTLGIKVRLSTYAVVGSSIPYLEMARELADSLDTRLMVHVGDSAESLPEILGYLKPGDIMAHCLTPRPNGIFGTDGGLLPQVNEAVRRGVVMDAAHGRFHFSFEMAERALHAGFMPATISTDLTVASQTGPVFDLPTTMDKYLAVGMSLEDVVARVTSNAASSIGRASDLGTLKLSTEADFTVFDFEEGEFQLVDSVGETRQVSRKIRPLAVGRAGQVVPINGYV